MSDGLKFLRDSGSAPHDSSVTHVTGKSEYIDDRPMLKNELWCGILYSPFARARIKKLDVTNARGIPGVAEVITAADVAHNVWGTIFQDQPLLAENEVQFAGEVVAVVGAETRDALMLGLRSIQIEWEKLNPILSIPEAIQKKSFIGEQRMISRGDVDQEMSQAPHRLKGIVHIQGADHFYLESQAAVVYPREDGQLEVHSSTQHPTETQHVVAKLADLLLKMLFVLRSVWGEGLEVKSRKLHL
ncbi:hypothetical protein EBQ90_06515 [bacterium]|nr:hypothetical protein [bacterium]